MRQYALAIDIGASSGRHMLGWVEDGRIQMEEAYRFPNGMIEKDGHLCWDVDALSAHVREGLRRCAAMGKPPAAVGIDTWGVDYVLLDERGQRLGDAVAYRDGRTRGMDALLEQTLSFERLYERTGIAKQSFNTVYQLMAELREHPERAAQARTLLFMPCYLSWLLTGEARNERSIASTGALVDAATGDWARDVLDAAGIPAGLLGAAPVPPGTPLGRLRPELAADLGFDCQVILPACHDTGSAYIAVPAQSDRAVYLSSGTWSLLGVERPAPILTREAAASGFTNEAGLGGVRFLRNIMGLWMLQCIRRELGERFSFAEMADMALRGAAYPHTVPVADDRFLAPPSMTEAVRAALREQGAPEPSSTEELLACVTRSLARAYADGIRDLEKLTGTRYEALHVVGGGCQNRVLNQWTANETGLPVLAGPVEGTALGNLMAQWIATGVFAGLAEARQALRRSVELQTYRPE